MDEAVELDEFEMRLESATLDLQECQKGREVSSCMDCEKVIGCEVRKAYVGTVYDSMSKGQAGGFEF